MSDKIMLNFRCPTEVLEVIALSKSNSTSLSDRFFESQHNMNRPSETEFVNSAPFSLSRCRVRSGTSKLNPTDRQRSNATNSST